MKVRISNVDKGDAAQELTAQLIDKAGNQRTFVVSRGEAVDIDVVPKIGLVVECRDATPKDPKAKILSDGVNVRDGAG